MKLLKTHNLPLAVDVLKLKPEVAASMVSSKMPKSEGAGAAGIERLASREITGFFLGETHCQPAPIVFSLPPSIEQARKELMARAAVARLRKSLPE
jgi:hypothetical protein